MAKSPEEKEKSLIEAIGNCTSLEKLLKFNLKDASPAAAAVFDKKKAELSEVAKENFIPVTKDGEVIEVCPAQVEQHQRLGWTVCEGIED